ncbi:peptidylprolyl isomerase [Anaerobacillus alkalilacustris]|uniref:peptidylprolyl isomerase n=1 Tax=Anaerobacillus alkalilacustris TaxID=393763 RepID=UPI000A03AB2A|nr:peptidylprolyl isomerase [Anaerobacillus alkalilacustris]
MRFVNYLLLGIFMLVLISGCGQAAPDVQQEEVIADEYPQLITEVQSDEKLVKMVTSKGNITIKLFPKYAPLAVENFLTHSENGYYDGVIFHRVIEGFMVQTGDPEGTGAGGESIYGERFEDEFSPALAHFRGALSMANAGPNTNGSQFFIVQSKSFQGSSAIDFSEEALEHYKQYGGTPHLDYRHTVFGHVIEGIDVVDAIAEVEVGQNDRPKEDITIETIELLN